MQSNSSTNNFKELIKYVKDTNSLYKKDAINYLFDKQKNGEYLFCSNDEFKIIFDIMMKKACSEYCFDFYLQIAHHLYLENMPYIKKETDLVDFYNLYNLILDFYKNISKNYYLKLNNKQIITTLSLIFNVYLKEIFFLIDDKRQVGKIFDRLAKLYNTNICVTHDELQKNLIKEVAIYASVSKRYYADNNLHAINTCQLVDYITGYLNQINQFNIYDSSWLEEIHTKIDELSKFDCHQAGIYDVDEEKVKELEKTVKKLEEKIQNDKLKIATLTNEKEKLKSEIEATINIKKEEINNYLIGALQTLKETFKELNTNIDKVNYDHKQDNNEIISNNACKNNLNYNEELLKKIKNINPNFEIVTRDKSWFNEYVINTLGSEYITKNVNYHYRMELIQNTISLAFINHKIEILKAILNINPNFIINEIDERSFDDTFSAIFAEETINILGLDYIANRTTYYEQNTIITAYKVGQLNILKELIGINSHFYLQELPGQTFDMVVSTILSKLTITNLNIDYIANKRNNRNRILTIYLACTNGKVELLQKLVDINPNFTVAKEYWPKYDVLDPFAQKEFFNNMNLIFNACVDSKTFELLGLDYVANSTEKEQKTIVGFKHISELSKLGEIIKLDKQFEMHENIIAPQKEDTLFCQFYPVSIIHNCKAEEILYIFGNYYTNYLLRRLFKEIFDKLMNSTYSNEKFSKYIENFCNLTFEEKKEVIVSTKKTDDYNMKIDYSKFKSIVGKHKKEVAKQKVLRKIKGRD